MLNGTERLQHKLELILTSATEKNQGLLQTGQTHVPRVRGGGYLFLPPFPAFLRPPELRAGAAGTAPAEQPLRSRADPPAGTHRSGQAAREGKGARRKV